MRGHGRCAMLNSHDHTLVGALRWIIDAVTRWPRNWLYGVKRKIKPDLVEQTCDQHTPLPVGFM
jgi:hypothetical protein